MRSYIIETIFCDNEQDSQVLGSYFARFRHTLASIAALRTPSDSVVSALIYISRDKSHWIDEVRAICEKLQPHSMVKLSVAVYDHPNGGYGYPPDSHIDLLKNPNKSTERRMDLFRNHAEAVLIAAEHTIRIAIDDDDLFLRHHLLEVDDIVTDQIRLHPGTLLAIGLSETFVGYCSDTEVRVECVALNRTITGNKFYVIPNAHLATAERYSPWQIPEVIDRNLTEKYNSKVIRFDVVRNNAPGLIYMRRQQNLSNQSKNPYVLGRTKTIIYTSEDELISDLALLAGHARTSEFHCAPFPTPFKISASRVNQDTVQFSTNLIEAFDEHHQVAFYLLKDGERIDNLDYGPQFDGEFHNCPEGVQVRAFVRDAGKATAGRLSSPVV